MRAIMMYLRSRVAGTAREGEAPMGAVRAEGSARKCAGQDNKGSGFDAGSCTRSVDRERGRRLSSQSVWLVSELEQSESVLRMRSEKTWTSAFVLGVLWVGGGIVPANNEGQHVRKDTSAQQESQAAAEIREHYTKHEYRIPMRDGAKLFTAVYLPKDASPAKTYPLLIERTPYSVAPYGPDNYPKHLGPAPSFAKDAFIFVYQDVRGRYQSDGTFIEMTPHRDKKGAKDVDESTDTYDTIEWLIKNV